MNRILELLEEMPTARTHDDDDDDDSLPALIRRSEFHDDWSLSTTATATSSSTDDDSSHRSQDDDDDDKHLIGLVIDNETVEPLPVDHEECNEAVYHDIYGDEHVRMTLAELEPPVQVINAIPEFNFFENRFIIDYFQLFVQLLDRPHRLNYGQHFHRMIADRHFERLDRIQEDREDREFTQQFLAHYHQNQECRQHTRAIRRQQQQRTPSRATRGQRHARNHHRQQPRTRQPRRQRR